MTAEAEKPPAVVAGHVGHLEPADGDQRDDRAIDELERVVEIRRRRPRFGEQLEQRLKQAPVVGRQAVANGAGGANGLIRCCTPGSGPRRRSKRLSTSANGQRLIGRRIRDAADRAGVGGVEQILRRGTRAGTPARSMPGARWDRSAATSTARSSRAWLLAALGVAAEPEQIFCGAARVVVLDLAACVARRRACRRRSPTRPARRTGPRCLCCCRRAGPRRSADRPPAMRDRPPGIIR